MTVVWNIGGYLWILYFYTPNFLYLIRFLRGPNHQKLLFPEQILANLWDVCLTEDNYEKYLTTNMEKQKSTRY